MLGISAHKDDVRRGMPLARYRGECCPTSLQKPPDDVDDPATKLVKALKLRETYMHLLHPCDVDKTKERIGDVGRVSDTMRKFLAGELLAHQSVDTWAVL